MTSQSVSLIPWKSVSDRSAQSLLTVSKVKVIGLKSFTIRYHLGIREVKQYQSTEFLKMVKSKLYLQINIGPF